MPLLIAAGIGGCGDEGISEEELKQAKQEAFERGKDAGYADGIDAGRKEGRQEARARASLARSAGFTDGIGYVFGGLRPAPGQFYAVSFSSGPRGKRVDRSLLMRPGENYDCPRYGDSCSVGATEPDVDPPPPESPPCEPSYPDVCLDPSALDYDCSSGTGDGPEYVAGPVTVVGSDPFELDGYPPDGVGCENG